MKTMLYIISIVMGVSLLSSSLSSASEWVPVAVISDPSGIVSIDISSIAGPLSARSAWFIVDYLKSQPTGVRSVKALDIFNCLDKTVVIAHGMDYSGEMGSGKQLRSSIKASDSIPIVRNSVSESQFNWACKFK
jgi:hypothetical protein